MLPGHLPKFVIEDLDGSLQMADPPSRNSAMGQMTPAGLEPAIPGSVGRWARRPGPRVQRAARAHTNDTASNRLRRWPRNPLGSARRGSNPLGVASVRRRRRHARVCTANVQPGARFRCGPLVFSAHWRANWLGRRGRVHRFALSLQGGVGELAAKHEGSAAGSLAGNQMRSVGGLEAGRLRSHHGIRQPLPNGTPESSISNING